LTKQTARSQVTTLEAQGRLAYDWDDDADPAAVLNMMGIGLLISGVVIQ
jgi:hypothetical protein